MVEFEKVTLTLSQLHAKPFTARLHVLLLCEGIVQIKMSIHLDYQKKSFLENKGRI